MLYSSRSRVLESVGDYKLERRRKYQKSRNDQKFIEKGDGRQGGRDWKEEGEKSWKENQEVGCTKTRNQKLGE